MIVWYASLERRPKAQKCELCGAAIESHTPHALDRICRRCRNLDPARRAA